MKVNIEHHKKLLAIIISCIVLVIIGYAFFKILKLNKINISFAKQSEVFSNERNNPVFKIEKVLVYSNAHIDDLSQDHNLSNVNISQYTDFAIYIDNKVKSEELIEENTINKIYIDNISIEGNGYNQKVFYKNINDLCYYKKISQGVNKIDYTVLHTNEEKEKYSGLSNAFYTDCSNPLILSYVNEDVVVGKDASVLGEIVSLDGSMLKQLGVDLNSLNFKLSFRINIVNNLNEKFYCDCILPVELDSDEGGIYTGYIMQIFDLTGYDYRFKKV